MEFKKLEIKSESTWIRRTFRSQHIKRSLIFIVIGAIAGFLYYYLTEGKHMDALASVDILKSLAIGGFFGFFITNSPCARNKC
jgi:hypothetical protein